MRFEATVSTILLAQVVPNVLALDNGFTTPPMGWSALYGAPFNSVNEAIVKAAAAGLNSSGLLDAGYEYVTLDDWWQRRNETTGIMEADATKFPSGMAATSAVVHAYGVKFGVYSSASQRTCGNWSASQFREHQDAATFAHDWQIDFLKYDACLYDNGVASRARYLAMSRALNATGRRIFYSVEGWRGANNVGLQGDWGPELANMWRTGSDIWPKWDLCILNNLYQTNAVASSMIPGRAWNDPDMIQPPATIPGSTAKPGLTWDEARSQFVLWCVMKAPLILGLHFSALATLHVEFPDYFGLITNPELIAIDKDKSPPAVLLAQIPSAAQQHAGSLDLTLQVCDAGRVDQHFTVPTTGGQSGQVQMTGTGLCIGTATAARGKTSIVAVPCDASDSTQRWSGLQRDSRLRTVAAPGGDGKCLTEQPGGVLGTAPCTVQPDSDVPPPLDSHSGSQFFIWDDKVGAIVSGKSGACLSVGRENMPANPPHPYTNNGTLHHEVWGGPLSTGKRVIVLFNKGDVSEELSAPRRLLRGDGNGCTDDLSSCPVRDVLAEKDLAPLPAGQLLATTVPSHGVRIFLVGYGRHWGASLVSS